MTWQLELEVHGAKSALYLAAHATGLARDVRRRLGDAKQRLMLILRSNDRWLWSDLSARVDTPREGGDRAGEMYGGDDARVDAQVSSIAPNGWEIGEFFTKPVYGQGSKSATFAAWRCSVGDLSAVVDTLSLHDAPCRYVVSLRPTPLGGTERRAMRRSGQAVAKHETLAFETRVHLAVRGTLSHGLADLLGARIFGRQGMIGALDADTVGDPNEHGTFVFERATTPAARRDALWNLHHGAMVPWERWRGTQTRPLASRLVTPLQAMAVFRLPTAGHNKAPHLALPRRGLLPRSGAALGVLTDRRVYRQPDADAALHTHVMGKTGMGKSALLLNIALQRVTAGHGLCLIDPHGELAEDLLARLDEGQLGDREVVVIDPMELDQPVTINPLDHDPSKPETRSRVVDFVLAMLSDLYDMSVVGGPMFETVFRVGLLSLMDAARGPVAITDLGRLLSCESFRQETVAALTDAQLRAKWQEMAKVTHYNDTSLRNMSPYVTSKLNAFIYNRYLRPMLAVKRSTVNLGELMNRRAIIVVYLRKGVIGGAAGKLLGRTVLSQLFMAAMRRDRATAEGSPFHIMIDEFQNIMTPVIADALAEVRKYGLRLTLAHQHLGQLSKEVRGAIDGNVATSIWFRLGARDADHLAQVSGAANLAASLVDLPAFQAMVQTQHGRSALPPFVMQTQPPLGRPDPAVAARWRAQSRRQFGRQSA